MKIQQSNQKLKRNKLITRLSQQGKTYKEIAKMFSISKSRIEQIVNKGKERKHRIIPGIEFETTNYIKPSVEYLLTISNMGKWLICVT